MNKCSNFWSKFFKKSKKYFFVYLIVSFGIFFGYRMLSDDVSLTEMPYTEFVSRLEAGEVDTVYYSKTEEYMTVTFLNDVTREMTREQRDNYTYEAADMRKVLYPGYDDFRKDVLATDTNIRVVSNSNTWSIVSNLLYFAFLGLLLFSMTRSIGMRFGIDKKTLLQTSTTQFSDIIGHDEIIDDVKFITELIKNPSKGEKVGAKVPKGLLLTGEPGTGKTLIAKAIAGEAGVPFLYQNASGLIEMVVGVGAKRVRELFKIAKQSAPCIIFIDEIDAIGCDRDNIKGTSENEQTINALLQEMDGFSSRDGVFIIAATNRADKLDSALVRSGRFDRQIVVNPPRDRFIRKEMFEHYLKQFSVSDDVDIDRLSRQVSGFTGADIAMICNEASIIAVMKEKEAIDMDCIEEAIDKKIFKGNRSKRKSYEKDREIIAYHESGHAVMSYLLDVPISRASIQSTISGIGGAVMTEDRENKLLSDKDLYNQIMINYAGRASEEIKFKTVTTGASNDITNATTMMLAYVEKFGFDKEFGLLDVGVLSKEHFIDSDIVIDKLHDMSVKVYEDCRAQLTENYDKVEQIAQRLLESETLSGEEINEMFSTAA